MYCQEKPSTTAPPTTGPRAIATPPIAPQAPSARPRFAGGTAAERIVSVKGITIAAAEALDCPGDVEHFHVRRESCEDGRGGEDADADREHAPPAEAVTERGSREEQDGEGERVGVDGPREILEGRVEIVRMTGIAVETTRLSRETMKSAIEVIANVQRVLLRSVIVMSSFPVVAICL